MLQIRRKRKERNAKLSGTVKGDVRNTPVRREEIASLSEGFQISPTRSLYRKSNANKWQQANLKVATFCFSHILLGFKFLKTTPLVLKATKFCFQIMHITRKLKFHGLPLLTKDGRAKRSIIVTLWRSFLLPLPPTPREKQWASHFSFDFSIHSLFY